MKIEVWSDFVCPFCYMGKRRLEIALNEFEYKTDVEISFKSFELDPSAKKEYSENIHELIAKKYKISVEQAKASNDQIVLQAEAIGLNYNFNKLIPTNTFDAHRLSQYAKTKGKMNELSEKIFKAYFVDSLNISDYKVLADLAEEVGISRDESLRILESNQYNEEVREDEKNASKLGIDAVPYFVFDDKYAVSGAQPAEVFLEALYKIDKEGKVNDSSSGSCSGGKCDI
ncbi:putative DsbA family dithiol-disulfide isomerase [Clostridium acetobutylicum]|uniref:Protein-disulfide isomerases DsbC/DsbG n=1 Tax=Clostridium acetobutylicum (strain ATCC 824 / DSM 792 / JCM 1419 / IAM 19013 / LMG 5710 / NBRC 13948 / NRRL B-527 / VKM B-1787 / 2291 / W) TaxID=272562 RepID=Q97DM6_CLOAB|nr:MULTISPECIES: DsbA family oxidoreductase [Clostridium]AAK81377.1 Protein-disulfide isomerases DsbC/DsbG [Clostridium acetobutylicum ATCC 824]ADZ22488.1 Protein-disulfide isomerase DsbC/DsbG [Clostridium acetobutylicum EA 2018]AEI34123.1 protein-disulfide isomerase DsbC/DsbG [Clostridium acetobutylicum DSM 1731]AWV80957.1 DsbA family oxidoreductase [Clostridium acetobutylicum]MBC2393721.1 DsbA family oxidoreductase [Clostridium acetobutylicum]